MKRNIIFLLVLIAFFAIPALAGTPKPENAPAPTSEDTMFLGLEQISDEELMLINGNMASDPLGNEPHQPINIDEDNGKTEINAYYNSYTGKWLVYIDAEGDGIFEQTYSVTNNGLKQLLILLYD